MNELVITLQVSFGAALFVSFLLGIAAVIDYSRTGPELSQDIVIALRPYAFLSFLRLLGWAILITLLWSTLGGLWYLAGNRIFSFHYHWPLGAFFSLAGIGLATLFFFTNHLVHMPSSILSSWGYSSRRLYPIWESATPLRLHLIKYSLAGLYTAILLLAAISYLLAADFLLCTIFAFPPSILLLLLKNSSSVKPSSPPLNSGSNPQYNILMIGADTLRPDKLSHNGHDRATTPSLDRLIRESWHFKNCFVPLARTAPSLVSMLTGKWPFNHGVRSNFAGDEQTDLPLDTLPRLLAENGYRCEAISDWSGADLRKFNLGFHKTDVPKDQWNLKYFIRQGPRHLRLFLSLFTNNQFGKRFLPEIFYQAGTPLTKHLVKQTKKSLTDYAQQQQPFFMNVFMGTTHVPFGSHYPYYLEFASPKYDGDSKFVMSTFRDPNEIMEKQSWLESDFDTEQINKLYDGCVRCFDDSVAEIIQHLDDCKLTENTIIVIYSDHGLDFFENQTWGQGNSIRGEDFGSKIPLIIKLPEGESAGEFDTYIRSIDLMPTLLSLCSIDIPQHLDGQDLRTIIENDPSAELPVYLETGIWMSNIQGMLGNHLKYPNILELLTVSDLKTGTLSLKEEYKEITIKAKDRALRVGKWKLEYFPTEAGPIYKLYDTKQDPQCRHCVAQDNPEQLQRVKNLLSALLADNACELLGDKVDLASLE